MEIAFCGQMSILLMLLMITSFNQHGKQPKAQQHHNNLNIIDSNNQIITVSNMTTDLFHPLYIQNYWSMISIDASNDIIFLTIDEKQGYVPFAVTLFFDFFHIFCVFREPY
jgi:hypothetical protein